MNRKSHRRCVLVCSAFIGLFSVFSFRLIYLQIVKHDEYSALAAVPPTRFADDPAVVNFLAIVRPDQHDTRGKRHRGA